MEQFQQSPHVPIIFQLGFLGQRERATAGFCRKRIHAPEIGRRLSISPKTVATHIQNLLRKLGAHSRAELVARAWVLDLTEVVPASGAGDG